MAATTDVTESSTHSPKGTQTRKSGTLLVGLDWGTNRTCLLAVHEDSAEPAVCRLVPTVVGYAREGILEGILPDDSPIHFGETAQKFRLHLRTVRPLMAGVIRDKTAARDFALHLRELLDGQNACETRAVIGVPAKADIEARDHVREVLTGVFDKVILIPEPFLAALGYRDESRLGADDYVDPVVNSLFIDIGGGSSDLCVIQGYYPQPGDQISIPFAGDAIDASIAEQLEEAYPQNGLSVDRVRALKEAHAYVGAEREITVDVNVGGKRRTMEVGGILRTACTQLLDRIHSAVKQLIAQADADSVPQLIQNLILTGGGSGIANLAPELERRLREDGFEDPKVQVVGDDYKEYVARGAVKAARRAQDRQWKVLSA